DVVADRLDQAALQPGLVRTAGAGRDAVDVGADLLVGGLGPNQGDLAATGSDSRHLVARQVEAGPAARDRRLAALGDDLAEVLGDAAGVLVLDGDRRALRFVDEDDAHAAMEVALALEPLADERGIEARLVAEDLGIRREGDDRAAAAEVLDPLQL